MKALYHITGCWMVSFHRFPRNEALCKRWVTEIRCDKLKVLKVTRFTVVCSKHFLPTDFVSNVASGHHLLHETAIPSVFPFKTPKKRVKEPRLPLVCSFVQDPVQPSVQELVVFSEKESAYPSLENTAAPQTPEKPSLVLDCKVENFHESDSLLQPVCEETNSPLLPVCKRTDSPPLLVCEGTNCPFVQEAEQLRRIIAQQESDIKYLTKQLEYTRKDLTEAKQKNYRAQGEREYALNKLKEEENKKANFCVERFAESDRDILYYTGLPSYHHFTALLSFLKPGKYGDIALSGKSRAANSRGRPPRLTAANQLFLVLVRLQINTALFDLAHRFVIGFSTAYKIFTAWIDLMDSKLSAVSLGHSQGTVKQAVIATPVEQREFSRSPTSLSSAPLTEEQAVTNCEPLDVGSAVYEEDEEVWREEPIDSVASADTEQQGLSPPKDIAPFLLKLHKAVVKHLSKRAEQIPCP